MCKKGVVIVHISLLIPTTIYVLGHQNKALYIPPKNVAILQIKFMKITAQVFNYFIMTVVCCHISLLIKQNTAIICSFKTFKINIYRCPYNLFIE